MRYLNPNILITVLLTVYYQFVIKWQAVKAGELPSDTSKKLYFLLKLVLNPWVISAFLAGFLAAISWMAAMTKLQLSYAFPIFIALTFLGISTVTSVFLHESLTMAKIAGMALIVAGIAIGGQE
jgi:multidrug transporter EmrE-like cation transporter